MPIHTLNPPAVRLLEFSKERRRPPKIITDLREEIDAAMRTLDLRETVTMQPTSPEEIQRVVNMKRRLDSLYMEWAEGNLDETSPTG